MYSLQICLDLLKKNYFHKIEFLIKLKFHNKPSMPVVFKVECKIVPFFYNVNYFFKFNLFYNLKIGLHYMFMILQIIAS